MKSGTYPGSGSQGSRADPIINSNETKVEYKRFKNLMKTENVQFIKRKKKETESIERQLICIKKNRHNNRDKRRIEKLEKDLKIENEKEMSLSDVYSVVSNPVNRVLLPNVKKLVLLSTLCPVGNAVVERLFSLMNITKTVLRNSLSDSMLDMLLRLKVEAPEAWTENDKEELVELWISRKERSGAKFKWKL